MKKLVIAALFVMGAVAVATTSVSAKVLGEQEQYQEVTQESETKCSGPYGQEFTCYLKTTQNVKQEQRQKILGVEDNGRGGRIHVPANTALDARMAAAVMGATMIGGVAYVAKRKIA